MSLGAEVAREGRLRVLAAAAAVALGLWELGRAALAPPPRFTFEVAGVADQVYGPARSVLGAGERVGVVIPGRAEAEDQVRWFTAQYALAPAIVVPVRYLVCGKGVDDPACGVKTVDRLLVAGIAPNVVGAMGEVLGMAPLRRLGQVVEYRRRTP